MSSSTRVILAFTSGVLIVSALALCDREGSVSTAPPASMAPAERGAPAPAHTAAPIPAASASQSTPKETPKLGDLKLGIVNLKECFDKERIRHVKILEEEINAKREELQKDLENREKEVKAILRKIPELDPNSDLYQEYRRQLVLMNAEMKAKKEVGTAELKEMVRKFRADVYDEVLLAVRQVSVERKLDLVLKADAPPTEDEIEDRGSVEMRLLTRTVLFHADSIDITDDVVKRMNAIWENKQAPPPKK
jgi:Skp family chaperone for outer membrane proteins